MDKLTLKELALPMIKAIDSFNYLLKSHHRRVAIISYNIGRALDLSNDELFELVIAASLHDIGALSVQERDMLIKEDVTSPQPHCIMGYHMLNSFDVFKNIAQAKEGKIPYVSHIIHLADRIDVLIDQGTFILNQKDTITEVIHHKVGTLFHPEVFEGFIKASKGDIFWIEISNMSLDQLFKKINFSIDFNLTIDNVIGFAQAMSQIIDFRSKFTAAHSYTVAHLASLLGKYFNFSEEKCKKLMIAGYLHDIGKIGIDPALIEKDGPLTDEEYNIVKLHSYYSGQILSELNTSEWFSEIVEWTERHHEKSDGSGYPYALDDNVLDEGVKLLAFADIITALMETRPYRKSMSIDDAFNIIDEKLAFNISSKMFKEIKEHKNEINDMVLECQKHTYKEYNLGRDS